MSIHSFSKNFVNIECCKCGVIFSISEEFRDTLKEKKQTFYCPNGHSQYFIKSNAEFLSEELNDARKRISDLISENSSLEHKLKIAHRKIKK